MAMATYPPRPVIRSVSELRRGSQAPSPKVNLYCSHCESQIGIFDNEWIRLTSTYARAREKGTHFGIETGKKIKIVPDGQAQKAAEGCGMCEVFCIKCSSLVGQYCRTVPDTDKQHLVGQYLYKMSRTYLKDAQTSERVDPMYGYGGDQSLPPPKPRLNATPHMSMGATPRQSQTPLPTGRLPRDSLGHLSSTPGTMFPKIGIDSNNAFSRLPSLEQQSPSYQALLAENNSLKQTVTQYDTRMQQMQDQINDIRASQSYIIAGGVVSHPDNNEVSKLREENRELKARFASIATAMGFANTGSLGESSATANILEGGNKPTFTLGKRKRGDEDQLPTPHSTQGSSGDREPSVAGSYFSTAQPFYNHNQDGSMIEGSSQYQGPSLNYGGQHQVFAPSGGTYVPIQPMPPYVQPYPNNQAPSWNPPAAGPSGAAWAAQSVPSVPPLYQREEPAISFVDENNVVEFSDDEIPGLDAPTVQRTRLPRVSIQKYKELTGARPEPENPADDRIFLEWPGPVDMDLAEHWIAIDVEKLIEEENAPKPPREPVEPQEHIQSTEKYLNEELEELGLSEWIGKDKRSKEYRVAIHAARIAHREAKKIEALARKGLRPAPLVQPPHHTSYISLEGDSPEPVEGTPDHLESAHASIAPAGEASPEAEVDALPEATQEPPRRRASTRAKTPHASGIAHDELASRVTVAAPSQAESQGFTAADNETPSNSTREQLANKQQKAHHKTVPARPATRRKSVAPAHGAESEPQAKGPSKRSRKPTKKTKPLSEVTSQQQNKSTVVISATDKQVPVTEPTESKHKVVEEADFAQENKEEGHVMTRRQQKEAEIQRRERLVQEAMEIEEA